MNSHIMSTLRRAKSRVIVPRLLAAVLIAAVLLAAMGLPSPAAAQSPCGSTYLVQTDDNMSFIAAICGVSLADLIAANSQILNPDLIYAGQVLNIPSGSIVPATIPPIVSDTGGRSTTAIIPITGNTSLYTVQAGDKLVTIAQQYGFSELVLRAVNPQVSTPDNLAAGSVVNIPTRITFAPGSSSATITGALAANSSQYYVLSGQDEQVLSLDIAPDDGLQVGISGELWGFVKDRNSVLPDFSGSLPDTQDYIIEVKALNGPVSYVMNVAVPGGVSIPGAGPIIPITGGTVYIIQPGDNLSFIADSYGVPLGTLILANPQITTPDLIYPGDQIIIP